jgi:hypothetical protein
MNFHSAKTESDKLFFGMAVIVIFEYRRNIYVKPSLSYVFGITQSAEEGRNDRSVQK